MAKKIKDTDYLYISARLKVLERNMLGREKLQRMAASRTDEEACKVLSENGWQEVAAGSADALEAAIAARRQENLDLLYRYAPDRRIIDIFRLKYDYHNIKAFIKAEAQGVELRGLLSEAGTIPAATLTAALREHLEESIPAVMYTAAQEATDLLARTRDPQLSDVLLDRAMMGHMLALAKEARSTFLQGYVRLFIDSANLRVMTRALLTGKGADYLARALCPGGNVEIPAGGEAGPELIDDLFGFGPLAQAAQAAVAAKREGASLMLLDKACDNALLEYLKASRFIPFGEAQVITYLLLLENELTSVRIIMAGRAAGYGEEKIMERLRLAYDT